MDPNSLTHYGVKGMKWGVRRTPAQLGHRSSSNRKKNGALKTVGKAGSAAAKKVAGIPQAHRDRLVAKAMSSEATAKDLRKALPYMTDDDIKKKMDRNSLEAKLIESNTKRSNIQSELSKTAKAIKQGSDQGDKIGVTKAKTHFVEESLTPIATAAGKAAGQQILSKSADVMTRAAAKKLGISEETAASVAEIFKETMYSEDFAAAAKSQREQFTSKNSLGDEWEAAKAEAKRNATSLRDAQAAEQAKKSQQAWARERADREAAAYRAGVKQGAKQAKRDQKAARKEAKKRRKQSQPQSTSTALSTTNRAYVDENTTYEW